MFSLEHKGSKIVVCSNLFLNNRYRQPCSLHFLEKSELLEQNIKIDSFLIEVHHEPGEHFLALAGDCTKRVVGRKLACSPQLMKGGQF